ncbi:4'-phosphopantetheinyl transferase family protein [Sinorhizobium meliloti]|uniref:4'-phosphopantetheinyl transferase family protein n=1 Tax=Rhizobium meliloti TaxID=382 RepID=UPI00067EAA0E|nr:4'-phosphopantetheinyl transferase superfamily protein [Sinorhizobium meliloti]
MIDGHQDHSLVPSIDEINVWIAYHDRPMSPDALARCRDVLSDEELEQERLFRSSTDRHAYLVTRATQRQILSRCTGVEPRALRFIKNSFGRPALDQPLGCRETFDFNISHDGNVTILGVANNRIGLDVAALRNRPSFLKVARRFFCQGETAALEAMPAECQSDRFLEYWTLKEAYVKARGGGLSIPLDTFAFDLEEPGKIVFQTHETPMDASWTFWQFRPTAELLVSICAGQETTPRTRVTFHEIQPFSAEVTLTCAPFRIAAGAAA